jgi:hypothetical protein
MVYCMLISPSVFSRTLEQWRSIIAHSEQSFGDNFWTLSELNNVPWEKREYPTAEQRLQSRVDSKVVVAGSVKSSVLLTRELCKRLQSRAEVLLGYRISDRHRAF